MKKILLALLAIMLLFLFAGCDGGNGNGKGAGDKSGYVYVPEYYSVQLPDDVNVNNMTCAADGTLYFSSYGVVGRRDSLTPEEIARYQEWYDGDIQDWMYDIYGNSLYHCNADGSGLTRLENYRQELPADNPAASGSINAICVTADGLWVLESVYLPDFTGESDGRTLYQLRCLDQTGAEIASVALPELSDYSYYYYLMADRDGYLYTVMNGDSYAVLIVEPTEMTVSRLDAGAMNWLDGLVNLGDRVAARSWTDAGDTLMLIDRDAVAWGESYQMEKYATAFYGGGDGYDFCFQADSMLYGGRLDEAADGKLSGEPILNWLDCDINSNNLSDVVILPDGRILCLVNDWESGSGPEFVILTKTPASQVADKTELTLAALYMDYDLNKAIVAFNRSNPDYRIRVQEYSQYNTEDDYTAGQTRLTTEIVSGNVPDLLVTSELPVEQYAARGLLEDLYPWIDQDPQLSRDDLVSGVLRALEYDGGLYQAAPSFMVLSMIGDSRIVGDEMGWTMADMAALFQSYPEGNAFRYYSKTDLLNNFCYINLDDYIDWDTGNCSFDSPDFIELLQFANTFPDTIDWENIEYVDEYQLIADGQMPVTMYNMYDFSEYLLYKALYGGDVTCIGFPTSSGVGNRLYCYSAVAMSAKCKDKEGAWAFLRTLLSEDYQKNQYDLPTNRRVMDQKLQEAMRTDGDTSYSWVAGDIEVTVDSVLTQEDVDKLNAVFDSLSGSIHYDEQIIGIIQEEAAYYFNGDKSAEDTARAIQSRMSIYVSEQM